MLIDLWPIAVLALIVGIAVDTSNICVVRAAEGVARGRPGIAVGVLIAAASATLVFHGGQRVGFSMPVDWFPVSLWAAGGATLFAAGVLLNGACAIGTLGRLARGELGYVATIFGAVLGNLLLGDMAMPEPPPGWIIEAPLLPLLVVPITAVAILATWRLQRVERVGAFIAVGVAGVLLYAVHGDWSWLLLARMVGEGLPLGPAAAGGIALLALLLGASLAATRAGRFQWRYPGFRQLACGFAGGAMMIIGADAVPGGNDSLLLLGIPSGNPQAIMAWLLMVGLLVLAARFRLGERIAG